MLKYLFTGGSAGLSVEKFMGADIGALGRDWDRMGMLVGSGGIVVRDWS